MLLVLLALLVLVPLAEVWVIVQVGSSLGIVTTVALLIGVSVFGTALAKHEGVRVFRSFMTAIDKGEMPSRDIIAGACLLLSGLLFLVPGFVTDVLGILLLLPPVRGGLARFVLRRRSGRSNVRVVRATYSGPIVDVEVTSDRPSLGSSTPNDESKSQ
ncbi:MAG: FxsA family protein [Actinobacteria bacterium]|nr:FxsA family protein [Actinomycetota bacterium]